MRPEAQRIAIAEACGWYKKTVDHGEGFEPYVAWFHPKVGHHLPTDRLLPDYLNDLNAMHEAEKVLHEMNNAQLCVSYREHLNDCMERDGTHYCSLGLAYHATASQRAEAFLKTINKWDDTK
jgi:hypothetical protein